MRDVCFVKLLEDLAGTTAVLSRSRIEMLMLIRWLVALHLFEIEDIPVRFVVENFVGEKPAE